MDLRTWASENELILDLYNRSFDRVWGFVPMSDKEWAERADALRAFVEPELIRIALYEGTPVG